MRTYVDVYFSANGESPVAIAEAVHHATGLHFVFGPHDLMFTWKDTQEFQVMIEKLSNVLKAKGVFYRFETREDDDEEAAPPAHQLSWPPVMPQSPSRRSQ